MTLRADRHTRSALRRVAEASGDRCRVARALCLAIAMVASAGVDGVTRLAPAVVLAQESASTRFAIVITGAAGGPAFASRYDEWRSRLATVFTRQLGLPPDHVLQLGDSEASGVTRATSAGVREAFAALRSRLTPDSTTIVVLIGHGASADGDAAKFNLVGPDLDVDQWAALVRPLAGRLVFVDAASGSFPYLEKLSAPNRIVLTANDSAQQQFETVLPGFFIEAFTEQGSDTDKNGRVSVWEAFQWASRGVARWYEERGRLATERPLLDDNGDGRGREADGDGDDGALAKTTYMRQDAPIEAAGTVERTALVRRRAALETALEELRAKKGSMTDEDYETALEGIVLEMARIDRQLRSPS